MQGLNMRPGGVCLQAEGAGVFHWQLFWIGDEQYNDHRSR